MCGYGGVLLASAYFATPGSADEVFDVVADFTGQLLPDAIVIVNEATDDCEWLITRKIAGLDGSWLARAQEVVGFEIIGKRSAVSPDLRDAMFGSTLVKVSGGFAELAAGECVCPSKS